MKNKLIMRIFFNSRDKKPKHEKVLSLLKKLNWNNINNCDLNLIPEERYGQYLKIKDSFEYLHYIVYSRFNKKEGRNSYVLQNFVNTYITFSKDSYKKKKISVLYLKNTNASPDKFNDLVFRFFVTLGQIILINPEYYEANYKKKLQKIRGLDDLVIARLDSLKRNNKPSIIVPTTKNEDYDCDFYVKCEGTLVNEACIFMMILNHLKIKTHVTWIDKQLNSTEKLNFLKKLTYVQIPKNTINPEKVKLKNQKFRIFQDFNLNQEPNRQQKHFRANIMYIHNYFGCFFCKCRVSQIIEAAHIYSVKNIKNNLRLSKKEKSEYMCDGYNGLFLCKNHHALFDKGTIIIDNKEKMCQIIKDKISNYEVSWIKENTNLRKIYSYLQNPSLKYLKLRSQQR